MSKKGDEDEASTRILDEDLLYFFDTGRRGFYSTQEVATEFDLNTSQAHRRLIALRNKGEIERVDVENRTLWWQHRDVVVLLEVGESYPIVDPKTGLASQARTRSDALRMLADAIELTEEAHEEALEPRIPVAPWFDDHSDGESISDKYWSGWYPISGEEISQILHKFGYQPVIRNSKNIVLAYKHPQTEKIQTVTVPFVDEVEKKTEKSISNQCGASEYRKWSLYLRLILESDYQTYDSESVDLQVFVDRAWNLTSDLVTLYGLMEISKKGISKLSDQIEKDKIDSVENIDSKTLDEFEDLEHPSESNE